MRQPEDLTRDELVALVRAIRDALYLDHGSHHTGVRPEFLDAFFLNPDKEWDTDTMDAIAGKLADCGLVPTEPTHLRSDPA